MQRHRQQKYSRRHLRNKDHQLQQMKDLLQFFLFFHLFLCYDYQ